MQATAVPAELQTTEEEVALTNSNSLVALYFYAPWAVPCAEMGDAFEKAAKQSGGDEIACVRVSAEALPLVSKKYMVSTVPTVIMVHNKRIVERIEGLEPKLLVERMDWLRRASTGAREDAAVRMISQEEAIMLFMKGTPSAPKCKFSREIVEVLRRTGIVFGFCDVLRDEFAREGIKKVSKWPTIPQLYAYGRLVGGLDVVRKFADEGNLIDELSREFPSDEQPVAGDEAKEAPQADAQNAVEDLNTRIRGIVSRKHTMLFMKGTPEGPQCKFSRRMVALLKENDVEYGSYDILEDPELRAGMKKLYNWPTYPMLFAGGELLGGLDVVTEIVAAGELKQELGQ